MIVYAFWNYDQPPYLLGAQVKKAYPNGKVEVMGFEGMTLKPRKLLLNETGEEALREINRLRTEYMDKERAIRRNYKDAGLRAIGE